MVSEQFRRQLRQEAETWWAEGLIDAQLYQQLADRYQLQQLERDASHRFIAILMGLGSILLGLGAITFVAANWQLWSRPLKLSLLLGLFLGINAVGFYLWRRFSQSSQRLGQGLLILGALLLGANLSLLSQMFHQSGNFYQLMVIWGLGVVLMAYGLKLVSLGVLAWILIQIGYWAATFSGSGAELSIAQLLVQHMPLVAAGLFTPLAYFCRSKLIFTLAAIAVAITFFTNFMIAGNLALSNGWTAAIAFTLPPALLWSYSSRIWRSTQTVDAFQAIARSLALWGLSLACFTLAFRPWWQETSLGSTEPHSWHALIDGVILLVITGLGWLQLRFDWRHSWFQTKALHSGTIAVFLVVTAGALIWNFDVGPLGGSGILLFNLLLFLLAIGLIRDGLALGDRGTFWGGMVLLVLGIFSRMLEYDTGLLLKSIVFALCGLGVMAAGFWFERHAHSTMQEKPQLPT